MEGGPGAGSGVVKAWSPAPFVLLQRCALLLSAVLQAALTHVLALGATEEVTTAAQEADAALSAVTEVHGATQGAGAASFPQENSGEDTQMLTAPSATEVLLATGAASTGSPVDAEGRILLQGLPHKMGWYI